MQRFWFMMFMMVTAKFSVSNSAVTIAMKQMDIMGR